MSKIQRLRDQLYLLQGSKCFYCDNAISLEDRSLEHVVPSCEGGAADPSNAVVVCEAANQLLGCATPKQKIIMLKAGGGRIECPKKCMQGHTHTAQNDIQASPVQHQKQVAFQKNRANQASNALRTPQQPDNNSPQKQAEQSNADVLRPMKAKQKNKPCVFRPRAYLILRLLTD